MRLIQHPDGRVAHVDAITDDHGLVNTYASREAFRTCQPPLKSFKVRAATLDYDTLSDAAEDVLVANDWDALPPLPQVQQECIARINEECRQRLFQRFGQPEEQVSRSLGVYGSAERDALAQGIAAMIDASNDASDRVLRATTIAAAEAVTPVWPELPA